MDVLSNEEKAQVFAMYLGQDVIVEKSCYFLVHEKYRWLQRITKIKLKHKEYD